MKRVHRIKLPRRYVLEYVTFGRFGHSSFYTNVLNGSEKNARVRVLLCMPTTTPFARRLLAWYDQHRRDLPWRGQTDPYRIWISEAMLQQTVVATVIPYYQRFLRAFPTVAALACADEGAVLHAWSGLGYYSRARSLKRAAEMIMNEFGGEFPSTEAELLRLPGVGPYTAAAVAAIAFGRVAFALDGNAVRVMARVMNHHGFLDEEATKDDLRAHGLALVPKHRSGDFAQAVMELGARVCVPRNPKCVDCAVVTLCRGFKRNTAAGLPRRKPRRPKRPVHLVCLALVHNDHILLQKRASPGLLGGTWTMPSAELAGADDVIKAALALATTLGHSSGQASVCGERVHHVFTHLDVWATVAIARLTRVPKAALAKETPDSRWVRCDQASTLALASFTKKLLACVASNESV